MAKLANWRKPEGYITSAEAAQRSGYGISQITTLARTGGLVGRLSGTEHLAGDGERMFQHACKLGLEGIVSKRRDAPYRSGRCKTWVKVKNPDSPAMRRLEDGAW